MVHQAQITHQESDDSIKKKRETASRAVERYVNDQLVAEKQHLVIILNSDKMLEELS